ncbi:MAG: rane protein involved in aromatic hydrocarbon degradation [Gemmatimonadetes bacterium]|nr:rane protein involved in aromatic hydrocarbon degradation [Gemmatimonadota bacterium]
MPHRASRYTLALALLTLPAAASAQAFGLNEIGACALARGFAATAAPCEDASSIYWNPAKQPVRRGLSFYGGAALIALKGDFIQDTTNRTYDADLDPAVVPNLFVNYRGAGRMSYGVGMYVPYGLTSQWGDDFPGRFSAKRASLQTIYVQPNLSFAINDRWSVGGGPVFGHSKVELVQGIDLSAQRANATTTFGQLGIPKGTEFARAYLEGSANAVGVNLGLQARLSPEWEMGVRFLSQLLFKYDGAAARFEQRPTGLTLAAANPLGAPPGTPVDSVVAGQFRGTGALVDQEVNTQITHPAQVQVGFAYTGFRNTTLSAEYAYVGWKAFKSLPVSFQGPASASSRVLQEDYGNTSSLRLGVDRRLVNGISLRGGFTAATSAAPEETVTPLLPEQDRALAMLGAGLPFGGRYALDATYARIFTPGRRGRIDERAPGSTTQQAIALNNGSYALTANIFALSLKASF